MSQILNHLQQIFLLLDNKKSSHKDVSFFLFFLFLSLLNLKIKRATRCCDSRPRASRSPFLKVPSRRENLPYFSLRLSILAGTNLILLLFLFYFCNPRLIPKKIHPTFDFRENSSSFDFRENSSSFVWFPIKSMQNPQGKPKKLLFFFAPCVFWICSRVALLLCHWI